MSGKCLIALMVRVPVAGLVKTRLIPALGAERACRLYRAMVEDLLEQAAATGLPIHLLSTGGTEAQLPHSWQQAVQRMTVQQGEDLGARMAHAFATAFTTAEQVLLVGSDIPDMGTESLLSAAKALRNNEVVINPAEDGGYCLLGLNRGVDVASIFHHMPWSTDQVLALTLQRLKGLQHRVHLLPPLRDIDTPEDLLSYRRCPNPAAQRVNLLLSDLLRPL